MLAKKYYLDAHCDKNSHQKVTLVFPFFCNTVVYPLPCGGYQKDFRNILSEVNFLNILNLYDGSRLMRPESFVSLRKLSIVWGTYA